jgi:hypothetical protein
MKIEVSKTDRGDEPRPAGRLYFGILFRDCGGLAAWAIVALVILALIQLADLTGLWHHLQIEWPDSNYDDIVGLFSRVGMVGRVAISESSLMADRLRKDIELAVENFNAMTHKSRV